jgi:Rieske Fe-S protein
MPQQQPDRRKALNQLITITTAAITAITTLPGIALLLKPVTTKIQNKKRKLILQNPAPLTTEFTPAKFEGAGELDPALYIRKNQNGTHTCLSSKCTHAGCPVTWKTDKQQFFCPCHNGWFDAQGKVLSGPPPKPLQQYQITEENGTLWAEEGHTA